MTIKNIAAISKLVYCQATYIDFLSLPQSPLLEHNITQSRRHHQLHPSHRRLLCQWWLFVGCGKKHTKTQQLFSLFHSLSVQSLRLWKPEEINNGYHMCSKLLRSSRNRTLFVSLIRSSFSLNKKKRPNHESIIYGPVGWGCRIHRLHLCRGVRHPQQVSWIWQ